MGDTFYLGKYQVESEDPWDIEWEIIHQTDDYQIAMTKQIIDCRPFDGKEPNNSDYGRKNSGNSNWSVSNIKQFLNSDQAEWYSAQHTYDAPPTSDNTNKYTAYDNHKGFLYYWSDDEKKLLKDMNFTLANPDIDGGGSYTWTGKVWLPTYTQMGGNQNDSISEGEQFSKFTTISNRVKYIHEKCAANNKYIKSRGYSKNDEYYYILSSVALANTNTGTTRPSDMIRAISTSGSVSNTVFCTDIADMGIAPCICIPRTGWSDPDYLPDLNYTT